MKEPVLKVFKSFPVRSRLRSINDRVNVVWGPARGHLAESEAFLLSAGAQEETISGYWGEDGSVTNHPI